VVQLEEYNKKYLIIGNTNAITYKEIFKLIKENKIQTGQTNFNVGMYFMVPDHYDTYKELRDGKKYVRVSTSCWFTNLDVSKHNEELKLYKTYNPMEYPKYDNYDAIEVSKVAAIGWISKGEIEEYMARNQHVQNANELWLYFQSVIRWVEATFPKYRKEMKGLRWGEFYNVFKNASYNTAKLEARIAALMADENVQKKSGIYEYVLTGDERCLNIRAFLPSMRRDRC